MDFLCPRCGKPLRTNSPGALGQRFCCPICSHTVTSSHVVPPANVEPPPPPVRTRPASPRSARPLLILCVVSVVLLGAGFALAFLLSGGKPPTSLAEAPTQPGRDSRPRLPEPTRPEPTRPSDRQDDNGRQDVRRDREVPVSLTTLSREKQAAVNKAIDQGLAYLKRQQSTDGDWKGKQVPGATALAGLTLLECGLPANDPAVQNAARAVRGFAPGLRRTYDLSLAVLFLDRLGDPADRRLIQSMALRLMLGQKANGGWDYVCEPLSREEERLAFAWLEQTRPTRVKELFDRESGFRVVPLEPREGNPSQPVELKYVDAGDELLNRSGVEVLDAVRTVQRDDGTVPLERLQKRKVEQQDLPKKLRDAPVFKEVPPTRGLGKQSGERTDNSNTQFAVLALWAAGRHHLATERSLALLVKRFRTSQRTDGSWAYLYTTDLRVRATPSMTCAGLLGLAVGHGLVAGSRVVPPALKDHDVKRGLEHLGTFLDKPSTARVGMAGRKTGSGGAPDLYFLWSVERVGMLFGIREIAGRDWYLWGVEPILKHQKKDGAWLGSGNGFEVVDTCFALLFLKRANLAPDLTRKLAIVELDQGTPPDRKKE